MILAAADTNAFWAVALGMGVVVVAVVVVLMLMLLSYLRDITASVALLIEASEEVAQNTAAIEGLAATGPVLELIKSEALIHDGYLESQLR